MLKSWVSQVGTIELIKQILQKVVSAVAVSKYPACETNYQIDKLK